MAEPIDLLFMLWTRVGQRKHKFNHIHQVVPICPHGRAHWCHPTNTIEPSVCGADAVLCHIVLTIYYLATSQYYLDVAYCYRQSSVVCLSQSVTVVSAAKNG